MLWWKEHRSGCFSVRSFYRVLSRGGLVFPTTKHMEGLSAFENGFLLMDGGFRRDAHSLQFAKE